MKELTIPAIVRAENTNDYSKKEMCMIDKLGQSIHMRSKALS